MFCPNTTQLGDHPATSGSQITARLLTLTASLLTLLMFVYYTTDITSKMTVGESKVQIKNFEDVLSHQYKVTHLVVEIFFFKVYQNIICSAMKHNV